MNVQKHYEGTYECYIGRNLGDIHHSDSSKSTYHLTIDEQGTVFKYLLTVYHGNLM